MKGVVNSEDLSLNISRETLQQNKNFRVIKKSFVNNCTEMLAETANENDDYKKFSEQFGECVVEQITDVHVPQIMGEIVEVAKIVQQERVQQRTVEEIIDVPVPQCVEESVEVIKAIPQERISERTCEQIMDEPVPQAMGEIVEVFELSPQERLENCAVTETSSSCKTINCKWQGRQHDDRERKGSKGGGTYE